MPDDLSLIIHKLMRIHELMRNEEIYKLISSLVLNLKQNSMARRHALFLGRHALSDSAMPFCLAPCHQNVPLIKIFTCKMIFDIARYILTSFYLVIAHIYTSLEPLK